MVIYAVCPEGDSPVYVATLREATATARDLSQRWGTVYVDACAIAARGGKGLLLRALNGTGWAADSRHVGTWVEGRRQ